MTSTKKEEQLVLYRSSEGDIKLSIRLEDETVWLSQAQMAELFEKDVRTVSEHIKNVFKEAELSQNQTIRKFRIVQKEGQKLVERSIDLYNLDVIISVGYRVKSKRGTQFRIWATKTLRDHILKGFTVNEARLKALQEVHGKRLKEFEKAIQLFQGTIQKKGLKKDETTGLLSVITDYAKSWLLLQQYDDGSLEIPKKKQIGTLLDYEQTLKEIEGLKSNLVRKKEASDLFGMQHGHGLNRILGAIEQSFAGKSLYDSAQSKAAHLLYFVIKDHPFSDGNKRIGSFLFILYLAKNDFLLSKEGERKISPNTLVALALLVAESKPSEKETMVALIMNLL